MPYFQLSEGIKLFYQIDEDPNTVNKHKSWLILSHGYGSDTTTYNELIPFVLPHFRILRWDHRGHGQSDKPQGISHDLTRNLYTMTRLADDLKELLDGLHISPINRLYLFGHSMGGMVAQQFAIKYPQYITRLILSSTSPNNDNPPMREVLQRYRTGQTPLNEETFRMNVQVAYTRKFLKAHPEVIETSVRRKMRVGPEILLALIENFVEDFNTERYLTRLQIPTLILSGEIDGTIHISHCQKLHQLIQGSKFITFPKMGHGLIVEIPDQVAKVIHEFCQL